MSKKDPNQDAERIRSHLFLLVLIGATFAVLFTACGNDSPTNSAPTAKPTPSLSAKDESTAAPRPTDVPSSTPPTVASIPGALTFTLTPTKDGTIWENDASTASGSGINLFAGNNNRGQARRALVHFDIASAVPPGTTVAFASLAMSTNRTPLGGSEQPLTLHRLLASWGEGASDGANSGAGAEATTGDVTWDWRHFKGTTWSTDKDGGNFLSLPSAKSITETWESNDQLILDVQMWLNDASANQGWIIIGEENTPQSVRRFDSREGSDPPTLTIITIPTS